MRVLARVAIVLVLVLGVLYLFGDRYTPTELGQAADVVDRYYRLIANQEFDRAILLLHLPNDQLRDWDYERNYRAQQLKKLAESGGYRLSGFDWVRSNGQVTPLGGPGDLTHGKPLRFVVRFQTEVQGKTFSLNEVAIVRKVGGQFRITSFDSVDHFVRFRAFTFDLPRVLNAPESDLVSG